MLSPKKFKAPLDAVLAKANELKVVVFNKSDFEWAKQHVEQGYHDITTPADPNAKPKQDASDAMATPADPNDPWTIKPKTSNITPKQKLDPSQMKQIVAPTDDSAYTSLQRVVKDKDGQLRLK